MNAKIILVGDKPDLSMNFSKVGGDVHDVVRKALEQTPSFIMVGETRSKDDFDEILKGCMR